MKNCVLLFLLVSLSAADENPCNGGFLTNLLPFISNNRCIFYELHAQNQTFPKGIVDVKGLQKTTFDPSKLNMFILHGWKQSITTQVIKNIGVTAVKNHDINVFLVDWSSYSAGVNLFRKNEYKVASDAIGKFINDMQETYNLNGTSFLLVGYGMGAHIAGNAGAAVKNKVDRIVGLDPAGESIFLPSASPPKLNPAHANYVEVIHTDASKLKLGTTKVLGHADYFPNGGVNQNGCTSLINQCDHERSVLYFIESLASETQFNATQCNDYENFLRGSCVNNQHSIMGGLTKTERPHGSFYLETGKKSPFAEIDEGTRAKSVEDKIRDYSKIFNLIPLPI